MLADPTEILTFIPQRKPMVMISSLMEAGEGFAVTQLSISTDNIFVSDNFFTEPGIVENIAQTAAVQAGYFFTLNNIPVPIGYIAMVKNLEIINLPPVNTTITTSITVKSKIMDITMVEGSVKLDDSEIARCEMRIFIKK